MNKGVIAAAVAMLVSSVTFAADSACESQADRKQLLDVARTSFLIKCEEEKSAANAANKTCEDQATSETLSGAAKRSFVTKCVKDATAAQKTASYRQQHTRTQQITTQHTSTQQSKQHQQTHPHSALSSFRR